MSGRQAPQLHSCGVGQGGSEPINDLSPPAQAAWLADVLDVLGLDRVVLVGHSLGGLVSLYLTLAQSQRIDRLVLIGSSGLGHAVSPLLAIVSIPWLGEAWIALPLLPGGPYVRAAIRASVLFAQPWHAPAEWWLDQVRMGADRSYLESDLASKRGICDAVGQLHVVLDRLGEIHAPTLVLWGAWDKLVPFSQGQAAVDRLPAGQLVLLPGCGHAPHVECPDETARVLLEFLEEDAV